MDGTTVYSKTPHGIAEISLRQAQLSNTARRALIMIDGKRTVDELSILGKQGDIENAIISLESGGLIQRVAYQSAIDVPTLNGRDSDTGVSTFGGPTTSSGLDERENPITLDEVKRRAVKGLYDRLGPSSDSLAILIEECRTIEEFRGCVRQAERMISNALGSAAAQDYLKGLRRRS
jgi:hypothetical protein